MKQYQFRFAYFTQRYDETAAFYRDGLGFGLVGGWDRGPENRGALFQAAAGIIEVMAQPVAGKEGLWDARPPQGAMMLIEVEDVAKLYAEVQTRGLTITHELQDQSWGHTSFCVEEPNGLTVYLFSATAKLWR